MLLVLPLVSESHSIFHPLFPCFDHFIYHSCCHFPLFSRADTRSEAGRSYNETIIRPVTRRLHTPAGTSVRSRSSRSHAGTSEVRALVWCWHLNLLSHILMFIFNRMAGRWRRETEGLRSSCRQYTNSTGYTWVLIIFSHRWKWLPIWIVRD